MEDKDTLFKSESNVDIALIAGCNSDLSQLNFSVYNLRAYKVSSDEFESYLNEHSYSEQFIKRNRRDLIKELDDLDPNYIYALVPIDLSAEKIYTDFRSIVQVLVIMFPSVVKIYKIVTCQLFDKKYIFSSSTIQYNFLYKGQKDRYLSFEQAQINDINIFIEIFYKRKKALKYLHPAIESYEVSFLSNTVSLSYISLCICLEILVADAKELSYRIRRNASILCSRSKEEGFTIFNNIAVLYDFRSKIVHTGSIKYDKLDTFRPYLEALASRIIIELFLQNVSDIKKLNDSFNSLGFGDYNSISDDYIEVIPSRKIFNDVVSIILKK